MSFEKTQCFACLTIHRGPKSKLQAILTIHTRTLKLINIKTSYQTSKTFKERLNQLCKLFKLNYLLVLRLLNGWMARSTNR